MICNQNILCLGHTTWENNTSNTTVEMLSLLARYNRVLYVDYQFTFKDLFSSAGIGRRKAPARRMLGFDERLRRVKTRVGTEVYVLTPPPVFPVNWIKGHVLYNKILNYNAKLIKSSIREALEELGMENIILLSSFNPFMGLHLTGAFNEVLNVYHCYDEIDGGWYKEHGARMEKEYLKKTDVMITTSDALYRAKSYFHKNCYVVKNGVDFDLFNKVADFNIKSQNEKKVVGYTGTIDFRFDTQTVAYAIQNLPEVDFVFVGKVTNDPAKEKLMSFTNVRFIGSKKPQEVPEFVKTIDVGIIPYIRNKITEGVYPLKINEYLAAGKAVVMTDFATLPEFDGIVRFAKNKETFLNFLREELEQDSVEKKKMRIETAKNNSWDKRTEEFSKIIEESLVRREIDEAAA